MKFFIAALILVATACSKKAEEPKKECKTCIARQGIEGTTIETREVCTDDDEDSFKQEYIEFSVSCE